MRPDLTHQRLLQVIDYDPVLGAWKWKIPKHSNHSYIGWFGFPRDVSKYHRIRIGDVGYQAHRLAWFYMTGSWPTPMADHKNRNKSDNRWSNLREATKRQNLYNSVLRTNNRLGIKGVRKTKSIRSPFQAGVTSHGKYINLGRFASVEAAAAAFANGSKLVCGEYAHPVRKPS